MHASPLLLALLLSLGSSLGLLSSRLARCCRAPLSLGAGGDVDRSADRARLTLVIAGPSIGNALFRAELKKELTFFRGASAEFTINSDETLGTIVAEGKREQLERFMGWVDVLCSDVITRKPSFQGPALVIELLSQRWDAHSGALARGFSASKEAPTLAAESAVEKSMDASSMAGTDESV